MNNKGEIRLLGPADLAEVGRLHYEAFPKDIRSQLGADVVATYFEYQLTQRTDVHALVIVDKETGKLLGFCFGGIRGNHASGWLIKNFFRVAPRLLFRPHLWTRLNLATRLLSRLRKSTKRIPDEVHVQCDLQHYEIFSLAVRTDSRNRGLGKRLMKEQEANAIRQHCVAMSLTSPVNDKNTLAFYERIGFRKVTDTNQPWTGRMMKVLVSESVPDVSNTKPYTKHPYLCKPFSS